MGIIKGEKFSLEAIIMVINYIAIGKKVRAIRKRRGLSQMVLAELIDRSPSYISRIETGSKSMSLETLVALANALNVSSDELLVDSMENTIKVSNHEFARLLADCNEYERRVLLDAAVATKESLRRNRPFTKTR